MSKHIHPRPIGISRTGKAKDPANWTPGENGMAEAAVRNDTPQAPGVLRRQLADMTARRDELAQALERLLPRNDRNEYGLCVWCGREVEDLLICTSGDCPGYQARAALAKAVR